MKIITGSTGRINELLEGIPDKDVSNPFSFGDGKIAVGIKGDFIPSIPGEVIEKIVEVEVIKEIIKEVPFDNPELLEQIQTLQDALSDALNAEEKAKREAEDLKKQLPKLKSQVAKLKKAIAED